MQTTWQELLHLTDYEYTRWVATQRSELDIAIVEEGQHFLETVDDWHLARRVLKRLAQMAYAIGDPLIIALFWRTRANEFQYYQRFEQSIHAARYAAKLYAQHGTYLDVAKARTVEVFCLSALERFSEAIELAHAIRPQYEENVYPLGDARLSHALAGVYAASWRLEEALSEYERAMHLFRQLELQNDVAACLQNMGVLAHKMDRLDLAQNYYLQAYQHFETKNQYTMQVRTRFNLAQNLSRLNQFDEALVNLAASRTLLAEMPESPDHAYADLFEAQIRQRLNQFVQAEMLLRQAIVRFENLGQRLEAAQTRLVFANLLASTANADQLNDALLNLQNATLVAAEFALPIFGSLLAVEQAEILLRLKRPFDAAESVESALPIFNLANLRLRYAHAQIVSADCSWRFEPAQAKTRYNEALITVRGIIPALAARCHRGLGRLELEAGNLDSAEVCFRQAVQILDELRRSLHSHFHQSGLQEEAHALTEELLQAIQLQPGQAKHLFTWVEHFKASALADLLVGLPPDTNLDAELRLLLAEREEIARQLDQHAHSVSNANSATFASASQRGRALSAHDEFQSQEISKLRQQLQLLDEGLSRRNHPIINWRSATTIGIEDVRALLDIDTILISYYSVNDRLYALTITHQPDDLQVHSFPVSLSEIDKQWAMAKRFVLRPDGDPRRPQQYLGQLYHNLLEPLAERLADKTRLIILPHRNLVQIPFAGLYDTANSSYVIQRWIIQWAPSASVLAHCRKLPIAGDQALLVGYPGEPGEPGFLLGVKPEIEQLSKILPNARYFYSADATLANVLNAMPGSWIIHLAGHNYFDGSDPLVSGMPLANGRWLRAADLYLRFGYLRGALVVLSGCDTGRGQTGGGDLVGWSSAFLYAGASAVVAGQWPVDDAATSYLMKYFYRFLSGGYDSASALAMAQRALIASDHFMSPFYWSPFFLSGDSRVL